MADFELLAPGGHQKLVDEVIDRLDLKADIDGYYAQLTAGAALGITGGGGTAAAWLQRVTTSDGPTTIRSIKGNTLVWNQLADNGNFANGSYHWAARESTLTVADGVATATPTSDGTARGLQASSTMGTAVIGHKYLISTEFNTDEATNLNLSFSGANYVTVVVPSTGVWQKCGAIWTNSNNETRILPYLLTAANVTTSAQLKYRNIQVFDLTAMFGAGNEPSTVAEFEALFPLPYYPYDAGSLLSVNMEGIETVGINQWDEEWEVGGYNASTGAKFSTSDRIRNKNSIPVFPSTEYFFKCTSNFNLFYYDADGSFISTQAVSTGTVGKAFTTPADAHELRFAVQPTYGTTYNHDICINLSSSRNGTYEPYWHQERSIPAGTLRSAGMVYDEQTETERIVRVGERAYQSGDESDATVVTDGTVTHYPLATPTTTTIDPPLNLTYRTETGGTERVMVPTGEQSAPPTIVTAQGYTAESLRDAALSAIAPVENGKASTNYGIGSYLVHGGQLCKVTTAIATGEAIAIGTNVTATTVMAEVIALIAQ